MDAITNISGHLKRPGDYKYVHFLMMLFITIFIVCETTAFRMTIMFGEKVPVSGLIIPIVFSLGDIIAEVYGYSISRKLIWNALFCQIIFGVVISMAVSLPSPIDDTANIHYTESFKHIIRTNVISFLSVSSGMFTNAFLMSKAKIWMNGKRYWMRTILSSSISEFVLCFVAYETLFFGLKSLTEIWSIVLAVWVYKVIFAILVAPLVSIVTHFIKKIEKVDKFDYGINYNPFIYHDADESKTSKQ